MATILIVDDDVIFLSGLGAQLEEAGYRVRKASTLAYGKRILIEEHPDLMLLEVHADNDAGWALLEWSAHQTTTIVLSSLSREEDIVRGLEAGAIDYIAKPYRSAELLARVRVCLRASERNDRHATTSAPATSADTTSAPATLADTTAPKTSPGAAVAPADAAQSSRRTRRGKAKKQPSTGAHPAARKPNDAETDSLLGVSPLLDQAILSERERTITTRATDEEMAEPAATSPDFDLSPDVHVVKETDHSFVTSSLPEGPVTAERKRPLPKKTTDEESVFMTEAEEAALLRMGGDTTSVSDDKAEDILGDDETTLGAMLRAERRRRRLTLVQVENESKIRMYYLQAMEDEKFTLLPRGPLAAQMLRSYANYLGLDADSLLREFQESYYTRPIEPLSSLGKPQLSRRIPRWTVWAAAIVLALGVSGGGIYALDRSGAVSFVDNVRSLMVWPASTPAAPESEPAPTAAPSPVPSTPSATSTVAPTPTELPVSSPLIPR